MLFKIRTDLAFYVCIGTVIFWSLLWLSWLSYQTNSNIMQLNQMRCNNDPLASPQLYSKQHEISKRQLKIQLQDLYYYLNEQISQNINSTEVQSFGDRALDQTLSLIAQLENFGSTIDNAAEWHKEKLKKMTNFMQRRIYRLQHPESCKSAKFLICELNHCGLGCLVHRVGYCLRMAAVANRTMILREDGKDWGYEKDEGWTLIFEPVTSCTYKDIFEEAQKRLKFTNVEQTERVLSLYNGILNFRELVGFKKGKESGVKKPEQLALSFPKQIADSLLTHHSNPPLFFGSQFFYYSAKSNSHLEEMTNRVIGQIKLSQGPIVGMHIRRTDKIKEAKFFEIEEYFKWAETWFLIQEKRNAHGLKLKRRVFIATDDPEVIQESKRSYPHYEIYANPQNAKTAQMNSRYTGNSVFGIAVDIRILSKCDYVVCTLSSNVCRLVYEFMQVEKGDASHLLHSLDKSYFNFGQVLPQYFTVVEEHTTLNSSSEHSLKIGDKIDVRGGQANQPNGRSLGILRNQQRDYPSYKVREEFREVDFPLFEQ